MNRPNAVIPLNPDYSDALLLARFETSLDEWVQSFATQAPTFEMLRYHLGYTEPQPRRGKRLRPRALLRVAHGELKNQDGDVIFSDALAAGCAIELLHNYSLIHDDIEDGDELRHGRQTVWARYGVPHGINAGDALCALSYLAMVAPGRVSDARTAARMAAQVHEANLEMCWGQGYDLSFEHAANVTYAEYLTMIDGKTAALFGAACALGAIAAQCDDERTAAYRAVGRAYGRAFQIRDDILGIWGETAATGKPSGADVRRRKWSFPIVWTLQAASQKICAPLAQAYRKTAPLSDEDIAIVVRQLEAAGAREAAIVTAQSAIDEAQAICTRHRLDEHGELQALFDANAGRRA